MRLEHKRILITGATGGIGAALAREMRSAGARVVAHGRDPARLARLAAEGFETLQADLAMPGAALALSRRALEAGPLDLLVHGAGVQHAIDFTAGDGSCDLARIDEELDLNLRVPMVLTRLLLPSLLARPEAAIVNVTSGLALVPKRSAPVYCARKAALRSFTISLRWQLAGTPVRVFEVLPPLVETAMTAGRGHGKLSAIACARAIVRGIVGDRATILIGKTRALAIVARFAPSLAERLLRRG